MSVVSLIVAILLIAVAAVWAVVGVLGARGVLRRNRWLGVRTPDTLASEERFQVANRVAAPGMLGAAGILVLSALAALAVDGLWALAFLAGGLVAGLMIVGLISAYGVQAASAITADSAGGGCSCCSSDTHGDAEHEQAASAETATTTASAATGDTDHASDCGTSCGACSLRGACAPETAQA
ncbi:SdpI family protein [Gordonia soli]|uniref:SdpI family protein n=1 Tax=Gordonia soli NBRC 108243 TaxID=1223545 RepID=M0QHB5_9ACTN|nr:SdpI family protein [Gordonia soli]GAC66812.1 hypothetical protein GS4_05_00200 [Gordonia soli NBRC 108243]